MPRVLIIAYGNPLRSDDGVACRAAEALEGKFPQSDVEICCVHQLTPELAEDAARAQCVIFVDAAAHDCGNGNAGEIGIKEIQAEATRTRPSASHSFSPTSLLDLALRVYGVAPRAFCVTLSGSNFCHGGSLSPEVEAALPGLSARLESLVQSVLG